MNAIKEIFSTIVKVTYTNYSENIIVNKTNIDQFWELIRTGQGIICYELITQGTFKDDFLPKTNERVIINVKMSYHDSMHKIFLMDVVVRDDEKIKLLFDTFGEWNQCFQTIKSTGKGDYMTLYGNRVYFYWDAPKFVIGKKYPLFSSISNRY